MLQIVPHHDIMAEHFLYLPLVGLPLGAGWWIHLLHRPLWRYSLLALLVAGWARARRDASTSATSGP